MTYLIIFPMMINMFFQSLSNNDPHLCSTIHDTLTDIEMLCQGGHYLGSVERLYNLLETCFQYRPVYFAPCLLQIVVIIDFLMYQDFFFLAISVVLVFTGNHEQIFFCICCGKGVDLILYIL